MSVTQQTLQSAIRELKLSYRPVCVHASLRSFGHVVGGANTVIQAFVHEHCTLLVPSYSWSYAVAPPPEQWIARNGWNYETYSGPNPENRRIFTPATTDIDKGMGAIAAEVVEHPEHMRGNHPLCSFSAVGPLASALLAEQHPMNMYTPLATLAQMEGFVVLMGVDLRSLTLLHLAEKKLNASCFVVG